MKKLMKFVLPLSVISLVATGLCLATVKPQYKRVLAGEIGERKLRRVVSEAHVAEFHFAADIVVVEKPRLIALIGKLFLFKEGEHSVAGGKTELNGAAGLADLCQRILEESHVYQESGDYAHIGDAAL